MPYVNFRQAGTKAPVERLQSAEMAAALARITTITKVMDQLFTVPGTRVRLGADALLGLVPVVGDVLSQLVSVYLIWEARRLGVSRLTMGRMLANSLLDTAIGSVPIVGDAFDVAFRANVKNLRLLHRHLEKQGYRVGADSPVIEGEFRRVA